MKPPLPFLLIISLAASGVPVAAEGPIARSVAREAERLATVASAAPQAGESNQGVELRWQEVGPLVAGQQATVRLADGGSVRGDILVVRDDALVMDVRSASIGTAYSGSSATIPRGSVRTIEVRKTSGGAGRTLGTVIGVLAGLVLGGYITAETTDSAGAGIPLFLGLASGMTVAGYYTGRRLDTRVTVIRIVA